MKHQIKYALDVQTKTSVYERTVTQNDTIEFVITMLMGGEKMDLTNVTPSLAVKRLDGTVTLLDGTVDGNVITFNLGSSETAKPGRTQAVVQLYDANGRVSSLPFSFCVSADFTAAGFTPSENERTLIEVVLQDGPGVIDRAERVVVQNETHFKGVFTTVAERDAAVTSPTHGDTATVADESTGISTTYRYVDATVDTSESKSGWKERDRWKNATAINNLNQQLADTSKKAELVDFVRYGKLELPSDFPVTVPFNLYRRFPTGLIEHDFDFDGLYRNAVTVYFDNVNGTTSGDGLTPETAVRYFDQAMSIAAARTEPTVVIQFTQPSYSYTDYRSVYQYTLNKNIVLRSATKAVIHSGRLTSTFSWTAEGKAYKTARSAVSRVVDATQNGLEGGSKELTRLNSIAEVQATEDSWYTDGTTVWIRRRGDKPINNDIAMIMPLGFEMRFTNSGYNLVLDNVEFLFESSNGNALYVLSSPSNAGNVYHRNCAFAYANVNGLRTDKQRRTLGFNSHAYKNGSDGFNYHGQFVENPYEFAFEYFCNSHDNGAVIGSTGNSTTAHEGMTTLRVGSLGYNSYGPVLADVNGCYSVVIDCTMHDSLRSTAATKAAYYFDSAGAVKQGKAYIINSGGGGVDTWSINTDGSIPVYVKNFRGNKLPQSLALNLLA